jgi:hypothetical protein
MFERGDRSIRSADWPLIALVLAIVAFFGGAGYLWFRFGQVRVADVPAEQQSSAPSLIVRPDEPLPLTLYVPVNGMLERVPSAIHRQPELQLEAREAVSAVLSNEWAAQAPVLKAVELRACYLDPGGTAYVDLATAGTKDPQGSAWDELLTIYALVNTLTENFTEIKQVRLLLDGREIQTLAGHVDLSRAFVKRTDLIRQGSSE